MKTKRAAKWALLKGLFAHNWREKLLALGLAFLLWFMIKFEAAQRTPMPFPVDRPAKTSRL